MLENCSPFQQKETTAVIQISQYAPWARKLVSLSAALILLASLQGCPDKTKNAKNVPGNTANNSSSTSSGSGNSGDTNNGSSNGGTNNGGDNSGSNDEPARELVSIPEPVTKMISYPLKQAAKWPPREDIKDLAKAPNKTEQNKLDARELIAEGKTWLHPSLFPNPPDKFVGLDAKGRVFLRLGKNGKAGLLSRDMVNQMETLSINRPMKVPGTLDQKTINLFLNSTFSKNLVAELKTKKHGLEAHPSVKGRDYAGTAILNPAGCGLHFQYLYVYTNKNGIVAVLQHVPNRSSPPPPRPK